MDYAVPRDESEKICRLSRNPEAVGGWNNNVVRVRSRDFGALAAVACMAETVYSVSVFQGREG